MSPLRFFTVVSVVAGTLSGIVLAEEATVPAAAAEDAAKPAAAAAVVPMDVFFDSAMEGKIDVVKQALTQPGNATFVAPDGRTALMLAAFNGHSEIVDLLIQSGAKVDAKDKISRTPLMYASTGPDVPTVALLLKRGADVNLTDGEQNWTPLMFATAEGHTEVVRVLLAAGADPNAVDSDGDTCLKFAEGKGFKEIVEMITKAKAAVEAKAAAEKAGK